MKTPPSPPMCPDIHSARFRSVGKRAVGSPFLAEPRMTVKHRRRPTHRARTALKGQPPASRVANLTGQHS